MWYQYGLPQAEMALPLPSHVRQMMQKLEAIQELEATQKWETVQEAEEMQEGEAMEEAEVMQKAEVRQEAKQMQETEAMQEAEASTCQAAQAGGWGRKQDTLQLQWLVYIYPPAA